MERAKLIIDSREGEPYGFDPQLVETERCALVAGDYSLAGLEDRVAVERKSLDDFVATVIRDRSRFRKELKRLQAYGAACIVVEADLADVLAGRYRSGADPASVFGAVVSIVVDYGIPIFFCSDRQVACRFTQDYLLRIHRRLQEASDAQP